MSIFAVISILTVIVASPPIAAASVPPTPLSIYGQVNYSNGDPVNDPKVKTTNLNTSEEFIAETNATSNYYQLLTSSCNVSAGNVLRFNASDSIGNLSEFNHTVTQEEMNNGGFVQNITIEYAPEEPVNVDIRADGINGTIINAPSYTVNPGTVTEDGITVSNQTAMGALVAYCQDNGVNVDITMGTWGEYVIQIGDDPGDMYTWMYAVDEVVPSVGGAQYTLSGGEFVHWYNYNLNYYKVLTTLDKTSIYTGESITATVTWRNVTGTYLLNGAEVFVSDTAYMPGTSAGTTGADGNCTFQWSTPGVWYVYAVDPVHGSGIYNYPPVSFTCTATTFDTGKGAYPSISGTHNGTITLNQTITVNKIYTYPCEGTGGHTEFAMIWNETGGQCAVAHWNGYVGDYHNITFNTSLTLKKGVVYNYTIRTGSYPQIWHTDALLTENGWVNCTKFTDANGRTYDNWIPAIRLFYEE